MAGRSVLGIEHGMYSINQPSVCIQHSEVLLLVIIRTIFSHFDRRTVIRETWAARKNYHGSFVHVLFFFGPSEDNHVQESLERESALYGDIVQYKTEYPNHSNLTLKTALASEWVGLHCMQSKFVLVADDNIIVDIFKLLPFLRQQLELPLSNSIVLCNFRTSRAEMILSKHNTISERERNFCSNEAYVASPAVVDQLHMTWQTMTSHQKDVWLSSLAKAAGVKFSNTSQYFAGARKKPSVLKTFMAMDYVTSPVMIGIVSEVFQGKEATIMRHIWRIVQEHHTRMQLSNVYRAQFPTAKTNDTGSVQFIAFVLMFIDFLVVFVIFFVIFCRRKRKKWW
ncbi:hypothetical protein BaRGS_00024689 [Batillaria attramentaria]|uniref:Hexosyltransferase n=1 Tax=Batillaria attramentaria TaxID=370345 RepID=A0ABD0KAJ1_9CAEN